ncbi:MAG: hypothetical protein IJ041_07460 [Clostridia bacterium]|nr:hypothetical protein [Clostridia bacterium]
MGILDSIFGKFGKKEQVEEQVVEKKVYTRQEVLTALDHCKADLVEADPSKFKVSDPAELLDSYRLQFQGLEAGEGKKVSGLYHGLHMIFNKEMQVVLKNADQPEFAAFITSPTESPISVFEVIRQAIAAINSRDQNTINRFMLLLQKIVRQSTLFEMDQHIAGLEAEIRLLEARQEAVMNDTSRPVKERSKESTSIERAVEVRKASIETFRIERENTRAALLEVEQVLTGLTSKAVHVSMDEFAEDIENIERTTADQLEKIADETDRKYADITAGVQRVNEIVSEHIDMRAAEMEQEIIRRDEAMLQAATEQQQVQTVQNEAPVTFETTEA